MNILKYLDFIHGKYLPSKRKKLAHKLLTILDNTYQKKSTRLELINLGLTKIPDIVFSFKHLKSIDLSDNYIKLIPHKILNLSKLQTISIRNNHLEKIVDFSKFPRLKKLYLGGNKFSEINSFSFPNSLEELQLSNCMLVIFPTEILKLNHLKLLWLTRNKISKIPSTINKLTKLRKIYLQGNYLNNIPEEIFDLQNLKGIYLEQNPMNEVPIYDWKGNRFQVLYMYFKNLGDSEIVNYKGKIILLGKGEVGKTTLADGIRYTPYIIYNETLPTEGIRIIPINKIKIKNNEQIRKSKSLSKISTPKTFFELKIWDFGSQEIQHNIHHFFLTDNALYLLLWTVRSEENKYAYFKRWLNLIRTYAGKNCQVILVQSKVDMFKESIDRESLKKEFSQLVDFAEVSTKTNFGFAGDTGLINIIRKELFKVKGIGEKIPLAWDAVKNSLENNQENHIKYQEFVNTCERYGIKDEEQQKLVRDWLHQIGSILFFDKSRQLRKIVILNPEWLVQVVYKLILNNQEDITANGGMFTEEYLDKLVEDDNEEIVLLLMQEFGLCFKVGKESYIIPHLLPLEMPEKAKSYKFSKKDSLVYEYNYSLIPPGVLPLFISKMYERERIKDKLYWRRGVILSWNNTMAKVVHELFPKTNNDVIRIEIRGDEADKFFLLINEEIQQLTKDGQLLEINIPCTNAGICRRPSNPSMINKRDLERMKKNKVLYAQCRNCFSNISVESLLNPKSHQKNVDYKDYLRELLSLNKLKDFFTQINLLYPNSLLSKELILLSSRFHELQDKKFNHTESTENLNLQKNKLIKNCLDFLEEWQPENF